MAVIQKAKGTFLTGLDLAERLGELSKAVLKESSAAARNHGRWLIHVREVGEALREAKKLLGGHGKWGKWLDHQVANCRKHGVQFSRRTARAYMQVARKWDDPRVKERREEGTLTSINAFLGEVRIKNPKPWEVVDDDGNLVKASIEIQKQTHADYLRQELRRWLASELKERYTLDELEVLYEDFHEVLDMMRQMVLEKVPKHERERESAYELWQEPDLTPKKAAESDERDRKAYGRAIMRDRNYQGPLLRA